jgi:spermidine/putrescine-binding protein
VTGAGLHRLTRRVLLWQGAALLGAAGPARAIPPQDPPEDPPTEPPVPDVLRVMAYDGQWPAPVRDAAARAVGMPLEIRYVASPAEARARVRAAASAESPTPAPFDLLCLGLEDVAGWRADGLLAPLSPDIEPPAAAPEPLAAALETQGGRDADGTAWLAPMALGFDVLFAFGEAVPALNAGEDDGEGGTDAPPGWADLLADDLKERVVLEPNAAIWMGLRLVDPDGTQLAAAQDDKAAARGLFRAVTDALKPFRAHLASVWTDGTAFMRAVREAVAGDPPPGLAGGAWDGLARHVARAGLGPAAPLVSRVPAEGAPAWLDGLAVPAGAARPEQARALIAALQAPEAMAAWAAGPDAIPADPAAWAGLSDADRAWTTQVLEADGGWRRLWFRPALSDVAAAAFEDARGRFEFP